MSGTYFRPGENKSCCPVCGKEYRATEFRKRWDGLWVCPRDYEVRHPQDFVRVKPDDMRPAVVAGCCGSDAVSAAPLCPFPLEPLDHALIDNATSVNLSWSTFPGVTSYYVYLWEDGDPQPTSATYTTTTSPYFATGLTQNTGYNWFVSAVNDDGEFRDCSGNARFFTTALPLLACPELVSPANEFSFEGNSITLDWNAVSGASSYNVYLFPENGPRQLLTNTASTSYDVTGLDLGVTYFWTVTAVNASGESAACGLRTFSTENTVLLSAAEYSAVDTDGFATIIILRNGTIGEVTADYATADDTAVAPTNYTATTGTVTWPDGDSASRPVQIPIHPLPTVIEYATDVLYPWLVGHVADPRNPGNDHIYNFYTSWYGSVAPAYHPAFPSWVTPQTEQEALDQFSAEWEAELPSISVGDLHIVAHRPGQETLSVVGPYSDVPAHERLTVELHYNEIVPTTYETYAAFDGATELVHYNGIGATASNAAYRVLSTGREQAPWFVGPEGSGQENAFFPAFLLNRPYATAPTHYFNGVLSTIDCVVECRRVPVAPPIPHADEGLPDWDRDSDFWYDESVDEIYSKEAWTKVVTPSRWLAKYADVGTPAVVTQYPIGPARPVGHADDTEAAWTAAYNAAVTAGTVAAGKTFNLAGTGGVDTYPRNADYYYVRSYKLPLWFTVNLTNPVGAELVEPDTATVYILPA